MPTRPTWSGSIQISLVSITVKIIPATNPGRQVEFHQIDRKTHKRVHHKDVDEGGEVEKADIVKGYEYAKDRYIEIDPEELKALRIPTATTMPIKQFVKAEELPSSLYERPYFVAPQDEVQAKALSIMRKLSPRQIHSGSAIDSEDLRTKWRVTTKSGFDKVL